MRPTQNNIFLIGPSGCGKTYFLTDWIVKELAPFSNARLVTNLPLGSVPDRHFAPPDFPGETFLDRIADVSGTEDFPERVTLLDDETLEAWRLGQGGPWDLEIENETYLILDEFATICHKFHSREVQIKWVEWFAKARHRNVYNLCISQTKKKLSQQIMAEFAEYWQMSDTASQMFPFGLLEGDLNQFFSKVFGRDIAYTQVLIRIDEGGTISSLAKSQTFRIPRNSAGYRLYDSFSPPDSGTGESTTRKKEWQKLSWPRFLAWFLGRNTGFVIKCVICIAVLYGLWNFSFTSLTGGKDANQETVKTKVPTSNVEGGSQGGDFEGQADVDGYRRVGNVGGRDFAVAGVWRGVLDSSAEGQGVDVGQDFSTSNVSTGDELR